MLTEKKKANKMNDRINNIPDVSKLMRKDENIESVGEISLQEFFRYLPERVVENFHPPIKAFNVSFSMALTKKSSSFKLTILPSFSAMADIVTAAWALVVHDCDVSAEQVIETISSE